MEQIKAVIRSPAYMEDNDSASQVDGPAANAAYFFPAFPRPPINVVVRSFDEWTQRGVHLHRRSGGKTAGYDGQGIDFVSEDGIVRGGGGEMAEARAREKKLRQLQKGKLGVRVVREDCFKIGDEASSWVEPDTSRSDFDVSIPPFTRLMSATRDFLNSRNEEFQFNRSKRLMESVRMSLGLRSEFTGKHCKGTGDDGLLYHPPSSLQSRKAKRKAPSQQTLADNPDATEEVCPLLRDPVTSVRGFLALVRRDAEAGWDIGPALKLARITSAFISFIDHYNVVPEKATEFAAAAKLARTAVRYLLEAKNFEDILGNGGNLNRALWAVHGGQWRGPERGGLELEPTVERVEADDETGSGGGWKVERMPDLRPPPPRLEDARDTLKTQLYPLDLDNVKMLGYVPFSRRKVVSVSPPIANLSDGQPKFMGRLYRVATIAAPWTVEERWRPRAERGDSDGDENDSADDASDIDAFDFEKEEATIAEPEVAELWIEADQFSGDLASLVGAGLRCRWALMGIEGGPQWWTCKAKDFVLPAFWQS